MDATLRSILIKTAGSDLFSAPSGTPLPNFMERTHLKVKHGGLGFRSLSDRFLLLNQQHRRQGPCMGHDSREAHIWAIIMPHVLGMDYIPNTWASWWGTHGQLWHFPYKAHTSLGINGESVKGPCMPHWYCPFIGNFIHCPFIGNYHGPFIGN